MTQSYRNNEPVSSVHGTPVFISEPLSAVRRTLSVYRCTHALHSTRAETAWPNCQSVIIITMHTITYDALVDWEI